MHYSDRAKKLRLFSLLRRPRGGLLTVYKHMHGEEISDSRRLFNLAGKGITTSLVGSRNKTNPD